MCVFCPAENSLKILSGKKNSLCVAIRGDIPGVRKEKSPRLFSPKQAVGKKEGQILFYTQ